MLFKKSNLKYLGLSSIGIQMALCVVIGTVGGYWLDNFFDTKPWILVVGVLIGFAAGIWSMIKEITLWQKKYGSDADENDE